MKVIILQTDIRWANPEANRVHLDGLMASCPGADLYVLPEMFSTGFCTQPEGVAETECETLQWMRRKAAGMDCAIAGSVATETEGKFYNRFYFVTPDGQTQWYDKKHLFTYGGEHTRYTAGKERVVVSFRGVRFPMTCVFRSGRATGEIMTPSFMWQAGRHREWKPGKLCSVRVPSRTSVM